MLTMKLPVFLALAATGFALAPTSDLPPLLYFITQLLTVNPQMHNRETRVPH